MGDAPDVRAEPMPGGDRIDVQRFDRRHERVRLGPHRHRDLELLYVHRGSGSHLLGPRRYDTGAGDVLLVTPGLVHDATSLGTAQGWSVEFDPHAVGLTPGAQPVGGQPSGLSRMWWASPLLAPFLAAERHHATALVSVPEAERRLWAGHLRIMHRESTERRDGYRDMVTAYLRIVLVALGRVAADQHDLLRRSGEPDLARVFEVIERRYAGPLSTSDVARAIGVTPGHLTTLVRRRTGRTVGAWITERRMAAARDLLSSTDLSAEQVAGRVGYPDPAYFSRRFRQAHGSPPGTWRAQARR